MATKIIRKIFWIVLAITLIVWTLTGYLFIKGQKQNFLTRHQQLASRLPGISRFFPTPKPHKPIPLSVADIPTPTIPVYLQKSLREIKFSDQEGTYLVHGRIESIKDSIASIVTANSRSIIRLDQLPLYQASTVEFITNELIPSKISDFQVESEVVIIYNYLGYPEKIVLIK